MQDCKHDWRDDSGNWNRAIIKGVMRCAKCKQLRIQPVAPANFVTVKVDLSNDRAEELQEPLPAKS